MTTSRTGDELPAVATEQTSRPTAARRAEQARFSPDTHPSNNLTLPRSALIGREHEVSAIQQQLLQEQVGLLTLTGPGGIGKTRLAMQVAANLLDHFVDGVYFVSLAPISDPDLVVAAVAQPWAYATVVGDRYKRVCTTICAISNCYSCWTTLSKWWLLRR